MDFWQMLQCRNIEFDVSLVKWNVKDNSQRLITAPKKMKASNYQQKIIQSDGFKRSCCSDIISPSVRIILFPFLKEI